MNHPAVVVVVIVLVVADRSPSPAPPPTLLEQDPLDAFKATLLNFCSSREDFSARTIYVAFLPKNLIGQN